MSPHTRRTRVDRAEGRSMSTPQTHQILPATPKKSSTSRCTTGDGGFVPWRTQDAKEYRERMAQVTAPTPTEVAANQWEAYERGWQDRIRESDRRERDLMQERIRRDEQRLAELKARTEKVKAFRAAERLVELALSGLDAVERSRVHARLFATGKPLDAELATAFANEEIVSRGTQPVEESGGNEIDWRSALKK